MSESKEPSLYDEMVKAGVEMDHHESDLYVPVNDVTRAILARYPKQARKTFASNPDGKPWYDIHFAYEPFWADKIEVGKRREAARQFVKGQADGTSEPDAVSGLS